MLSGSTCDRSPQMRRFRTRATSRQRKVRIMGPNTKILFASLAAITAATFISAPAIAQQKPNIVVIMGDDIGITNIGVYGH